METDAQLIEKYLEHVRVEKRLAQRTVELYALDLQKLAAHAAQAGRHCLSAAGVPLSDVGLLINTGVYRDDNLVEPAMAALIQGDIGMGLDFTKYPGEPPVVSFDLMNGACGLLNAVQVADSFLRAGGVRHVLIVSSDAHPGDRADDAYPYATLGGAVLLSQGEGDEQGFGSLSVRASQAGATPGVTGYVPLGHGARVQIRVDREPDYSERLCAFAAETAQAYVYGGASNPKLCL